MQATTRDALREDLLSRLQTLSRDQCLQRIQLELTLETTPRDSRYSAGLVDLMKREETISKDGTLAQVSDLYRRVDEALSQETHRFFARTASQNIKRWQALNQKLDRERDRFRNETIGRVVRRGSSGGETQAQRSERRVLTADDLVMEELRLEEDYNRNFLKHEGFSLREAFSSQAARVDKDWAVHEEQLADDYQTRRRSIVGVSSRDGVGSSPSTASPSRDHQDGGRWQHPEKQKTLIHTAPVLSPTTAASVTAGTGAANSGSRPRGSRGSLGPDAAQTRELEKLERQYAGALESLEKQKASAMRWMSRQQVRLTAQLEEVQVERAATADLLARQIKDFKAMREAILSLGASPTANNLT